MHSITQFLSEILTRQNGSISFGQAFLAVIFAYFGGILSSLTPCVYPMIPITVGVVGGVGTSKETRPWNEIVLRGMIYVSGMTLVYSFLGVLAGLTGRVFGSSTNTSSWNLGIGIIITVAALMMLDVLQFDPYYWLGWLKQKFKRGSMKKPNLTSHDTHQELTWIGIFFLGATSGFIAAPCTTPVLTSILAFIAQTQSVGLGFGLMVAFSLGLGTLLLIIASFAGAFQALPRSGGWMKQVKTLSGLILLAFAEYLIYRAGSFGGS